MSLKPVQPSQGLPPPSNANAKTGVGNGMPLAAGSGTDTVRLSNQGRMLSTMPNLAPPSPGDVRKLSEALANELKSLFRQNAVDAQKDVAFEVDPGTGEVGVKEDRPDAREIAALIAAHPDVGRQIRAIAALSAHLYVSEQGADLRLSNRMAQSAAQVSAFVASYSSRTSQENDTQAFSMIPGERTGGAAVVSRWIAKYAATAGTFATTNVSVIFNGADIRVNANGRPWIFSTA